MLAPDLLRDLQALVGPDGVIADDERLAVYDRDGFTLVYNRPDAVVFPRNTAEAAGVLRRLHQAGVLVIPRGAATSLSGGTLALGGGVAVCTSRMKRVLEVDARNRMARVEGGLANLELSRRVAHLGLMYAPDPSSQNSSTIGGNIATNAGGPHTLKAGVTINHVLGVTLVRADGEVITVGGPLAEPPDIALLSILVGSEGRCGLVTEAWVRLVPLEKHVRTLLAVFDTIADAAGTVVDVTASGVLPVAIEMMDQLMITAVEQAVPTGLPPDAAAVLLIELDGIAAGLDEQLAVVRGLCARNRARSIKATADPDERAALWKARKTAFGAIGRLSPTYCTQDGVVPRSALPDVLAFVADAARRYRVRIGNVFHAGDGNLHPILLYREHDAEEIERVLAASDEILDECLRVGGSITGEHGIGVEKRANLRRMYRPVDLAPMQVLRDLFDPQHRLNRGKVYAEPGEDERLSRLIRPMRAAPQ